MKKRQIILIFGLIRISIIIVISFFLVNCFLTGSYIKETVLEKDIVIDSEWKEINTKNLITFEKDNQYISILLKPPYKFPKGESRIELPNGNLVNPEIKLIDTEGNEYLFSYIGGRYSGTSEYVNYGYRGNKESLPTNKSYVKLLVRSDSPIELKKILWSGYDSKDLK